MTGAALVAPVAAVLPPLSPGRDADDGEGTAVVVDGLVKAYGARRALDDVGFTAGTGITGILGPNGAGKTTLLRCLAGISGWDSGRITLNGHDAERHGSAARRMVGFMPEAFAVPGEMRVEPYLRFAAAAKGIPKAERAEAVDEALTRSGLAGIRGRILANLSKGYRQRVGLAQAVLGQPPVVVLDEPTAGLDPLTVLDVRQMLADYGRDRAVLLSTHTLGEARLLCDRLVVLGAGRVVYDGPTAAMASSGSTRDVRFRFAPGPGAIDVDKLVSVVAGAGWEVLGVEPTDDALEEAFRAAVLGAGSPATGAEES